MQGLPRSPHPARTSAVRLHGLLVLGVLALLLGGCGGKSVQRHRAAGNDVVFTAMGLVGTPYRWGGNTPETGFDCSGLVGYVFSSAAGLSLPRTSLAISKVDAPKVKREKLVAGDLVFFHGRRSRISHVGIYVGDGRFVHAPDRGGTVRLDALDGPYWTDHFSFGRRVLAPRR